MNNKARLFVAPARPSIPSDVNHTIDESLQGIMSRGGIIRVQAQTLIATPHMVCRKTVAAP